MAVYSFSDLILSQGSVMKKSDFLSSSKMFFSKIYLSILGFYKKRLYLWILTEYFYYG